MKSEWCEEVEQRRGRAASNTVFVKQVYRRRPFSFDTAVVKICFMELITSWRDRGARHPDNNQIILQRMAGAPRDWTRRSQITRYLLADIAL